MQKKPDTSHYYSQPKFSESCLRKETPAQHNRHLLEWSLLKQEATFAWVKDGFCLNMGNFCWSRIRQAKVLKKLSLGQPVVSLQKNWGSLGSHSCIYIFLWIYILCIYMFLSKITYISFELEKNLAHISLWKKYMNYEVLWVTSSSSLVIRVFSILSIADLYKFSVISRYL